MKSTPATQISFAQTEYAKKRKRTRREAFLDKMEQVAPGGGDQAALSECALRIPLRGTIDFADVLRRLRLLVA